MAIPSGYQKITIPWGGSLLGNIYVWINPNGGNQTVYIQSDENTVESSRSKTLTFKTTTSGLSTTAQSVASLNVTQAAAIYTYTLTISASSYTHDAGGDMSTLSATLITYRNGKQISSGSVSPNYTFSGTHTGFTIDNDNELLSENRGTTTGSSRSCKVYATYYVNGRTVTSNTITITQEENIEYLNTISLTGSVSSGTVTTIPYTGGTVTWTARGNYKYTSGSTTTKTITSNCSWSVSGTGATQSSNKTTWSLNDGSANRSATVRAYMSDPGTGETINGYATTTQLKDNYVAAQYSSVVATYSNVKSVWDN